MLFLSSQCGSIFLRVKQISKIVFSNSFSKKGFFSADLTDPRRHGCRLEHDGHNSVQPGPLSRISLSLQRFGDRVQVHPRAASELCRLYEEANACLWIAAHIAGYMRLGCICRDRGQIYDSSIWFKQAIPYDEVSHDAWTLIGNLHMSKNEWVFMKPNWTKKRIDFDNERKSACLLFPSKTCIFYASLIFLNV